MKLRRSLSLPLSSALLVALSLTGCSSNKVVDAALVLTIACDAAVPFAGTAAPYVASAADLAQFTAIEAASPDAVPVQVSKIDAEAARLALLTPSLANASPGTKAKVQAVIAAVDALMLLVHQAPAAPVTAPDPAKVQAVLSRSAAVKAKVAGQ
jgi:hypothetical protein